MSAQGPKRSEDGSKLGIANEVLVSHLGRTNIGKALEAGGFSIKVSTQDGSAADIAATSEAVAKASDHLDTVLETQGNPKIKAGDISAAVYRDKVELVPRHQIPTEELHICRLTAIDWSLIDLAARTSEATYDKNVERLENEGYKILKQTGGIKPAILKAQSWNGEQILVIGIRGTVSLRDWALDINSGPSDPNMETAFHLGFLKTAKLMEPEVVKLIQMFRPQGSQINRVLFTGHSLGGAIAQLFYMFSSAEGTLMRKAIGDDMIVECITFGTPPVCSKRIACRTGSRFFTVVNEGVPIPLAQESFLPLLLEVYALSPRQIHMKLARGLEIPAAYFHLSGTCILLKEDEYDDIDEDKDQEENWTAYEVSSTDLERAFFGDYQKHFIAEYVERVKFLSKSA